jgi:hypothetical protein
MKVILKKHKRPLRNFKQRPVMRAIMVVIGLKKNMKIDMMILIVYGVMMMNRDFIK